MRFFIDHCVPRSVSDFLKHQGYNVHLLRDHLPTNTPDQQVISEAQSLNAILLTLNGDFADLIIYPPHQYHGIIALQVKNRPEVIDQILERLNNYFLNHPLQDHYSGKLLLIEPHRIRVRK